MGGGIAFQRETFKALKKLPDSFHVWKLRVHYEVKEIISFV